MESIAKTAFLVSLAALVVFLILDYAKPGFVSDHLSVHVFTAAALVSGVWWSRYAPRGQRPLVGGLLAIAAGALAAAVVWDIGRPFGDFRPLMMIVVFLLPPAVWNLMNERITYE